MKRTLPIAAALAVMALGVAMASSPLSARAATGFSGSALRAVSGLTEPGALVLWASALAVLAQVFSRRSSSN